MGCEVYYFSGAYSSKLKRELNIDQLFSVYHEKKLVIDTIKYKREHPEYTGKLMLDSGAFSLYQMFKKKNQVLTDDELKVYVDDYIAYLNEWGDELECFVGVDTVPNPDDVDQTFAQKTWDNYLYMWEHLRPEIRHKLIPVFHYGEDFKWLKNMLEHVHPDGSKVAYLGLAISLEGTRNVRIAWGQDCMKIIADSSNPDVKTHAFGVGVKSVLEHINVTSTDATSWVKRAAYGMISIDDKTIYITDRQKEKFDGRHYEERSTAFQDVVTDRIAKNGFTLDPYDVPYTLTSDDMIVFTTAKGTYTGRLISSTELELTKHNEDESVIFELEEKDESNVNKFTGVWKVDYETLTIEEDRVLYDDGYSLKTNCYARARFNILDTLDWMKGLKTHVAKSMTKVNLGW